MKNIFKFLSDKNKKKSMFLWIIILIVAVTSSIFIGKVLLRETKNEDLDISVVLEKAEYSYLPVEAKNYIKIVYEKTGQLVLTEKNKEKGQPYLNPKFVTYLSMSSNEREKEALIPKELIVDYVYSEDSSNTVVDEIPSKFDLRNVDGNNYVTPLKKQGDLEICWSFATIGQAESYLLAQNKVSYSDSAKIFSERQLDYATSNDGLKDYTSEFASYRSLGGGGNFIRAVYPMISGLALNDVSWKEYNDHDYAKMEAYEVLNFEASEYEVNGTYNIPFVDFRELSTNDKNNYLSTVKNYIMQYGGAYVGTQGPHYSCSAKNVLDESESYIIREDDTCNPDGAHAMLIIGWDDDYEYSYCEDGSRHVSGTSCNNSQTLVKGKGAWLLKNSWGENSGADYVYLAYDSLNNDINLINDISDIDNKKWDNVYFDNSYINTPYLWRNTAVEVIIDPEVDDVLEKVEKVKFQTYTQNGIYKVYLYKDGVPRLLETVETTMPGIYNVDLSKFDITIAEGDKATLHFVGIDDSYIMLPVFAYTSNVEENAVAVTEDYSYSNSLDATTDDYYEFRLITNTRNIASMEKIDYKLFDSNGNDVSNYLSYSDNYVAHNVVNSSIKIYSEVSLGDYTLQTIYGEEVLYESKVSLPVEVNIVEGSGTENDPYVITTSEELALIEDAMDAHYKLGNDIIFDSEDYDNWVPIGSYYEESFSGVLDGAGYTISGINITDENMESSGLFYKLGVKYEHNTVIKNINFSNIYVSGYYVDNDKPSYNGVIAGYASDCYDNIYCDSDKKIVIENISVQNSTIIHANYSGSLVGKIDVYNKDGIIINNVYSDSLLSATDCIGGFVGKISSGQNLDGTSVKFSNIQFLGILDLTLSAAFPDYGIHSDYAVGQLVGNLTTNIKINNTLLTGQFKNLWDDFASGAFIGSMGEHYSSYNEKKYDAFNIYYVNDLPFIWINYYDLGEDSPDYQKDIDLLTDGSLYSDWEDFDIYWNMEETLDGIPRIPILKFVDFEYTSIPDIRMELGDKVNIYDLIIPNNDLAKNISYEIADEEIATVAEDGTITAVEKGNTTIHVISNYDGYEKDIPVVVSSVDYKILFDANNGKGEMAEQVHSYGITSKLSKNLFTRDGYTFKGWNSEADGTGISYNDEEEILNLTNEAETIILYAQWSPIKYSIRYVANGGEGREEIQELVYDKSDFIPDIGYIKEGYNFSAWNTSSDGTGTSYVSGQEILNLSVIEQEVVLYAQWSPITYFVGFDSNFGTGEMSLQEFIYDQSNNLSSNSFVREGYKFVGWNSESDGSGTGYSDEESVISLFNVEGGVVTLYAQWSPIKYTISFDSNGGNGDIVSQEFTYGISEKLNSNTFEREGHVFSHWNTNPLGTDVSYNDNQEIINLTTKEESIVLYAQWTPNKYTVSFDKNNGSGEMVNQEFTYGVSKSLSVNTFTKEGYKFAGWNTDSEGKGISYTDGQQVSNLTSLSGEVILYAQWTPIKYTVSFDKNSGVGEMDIQDFIYDRAGNLKYNEYNKIGYTFKEWNSDIEGKGIGYQNGQEIINLLNTEGNIILYAQWTPINYSVRFDANGGEGNIVNQSFMYDESGNLSKNVFTREGYKFVGWNSDAEGKGIDYSDEAIVSNLGAVNGDVVTLYAQWTPISYSVRFDANGGEGSMDIIDFVYDVEQQLPENLFIRDGYEIKEWNTKADGNGMGYKDRALVNNLTTNEETITLYVIWKVKLTYQINNYEFDANGYLTRIEPQTSVDDYLKNITIGNNYGVKVFELSGKELNNSDLIFTGSTTKIYLNNEVVETFVNIIRGDIDADGEVIVSDISKLYRFTKGKAKLDEAYNLLAADVDGDGFIDVADIAKMYRYTKGKVETLY